MVNGTHIIILIGDGMVLLMDTSIKGFLIPHKGSYMILKLIV